MTFDKVHPHGRLLDSLYGVSVESQWFATIYSCTEPCMCAESALLTHPPAEILDPAGTEQLAELAEKVVCRYGFVVQLRELKCIHRCEYGLHQIFPVMWEAESEVSKG